MDKDFHIDCYVCEDCGIQLTDEQERRCYPIGKTLLCFNCHLKRIGIDSNINEATGTNGVNDASNANETAKYYHNANHKPNYLKNVLKVQHMQNQHNNHNHQQQQQQSYQQYNHQY
jgi:hypothetical protein